MFGSRCSDGWLFPGRQLTEARSRVLYLVENRAPAGHIVATSGSGRSTLMHLLQDDLRRMGCSVVSLNLSAADADSVTQQLASQLSVCGTSATSAAARLLQIREELLGRTGCGRQVVLLLDDVHRCAADTDATLEFLSNVADSIGGPMCIVTAGVSHDDCSHASRCPMRIQLQPLPAAEAIEFLQQRLALLGIPRERITSSAVRTLVEGAAGLPRRLLHVCSLIRAVCDSNAAEEIHPSIANAVLSSGLNRAA